MRFKEELESVNQATHSDPRDTADLTFPSYGFNSKGLAPLLHSRIRVYNNLVRRQRRLGRHSFEFLPTSSDSRINSSRRDTSAAGAPTKICSRRYTGRGSSHECNRSFDVLRDVFTLVVCFSGAWFVTAAQPELWRSPGTFSTSVLCFPRRG